PIVPEVSQVLAKVFKSLRSQGISPAHVAEQLRISQTELDQYVFGLVPVALEGASRSVRGHASDWACAWYREAAKDAGRSPSSPFGKGPHEFCPRTNEAEVVAGGQTIYVADPPPLPMKPAALTDSFE